MTKEVALEYLRKIIIYEFLSKKQTEAIKIAIKSLEGDIANERLTKN